MTSANYSGWLPQGGHFDGAGQYLTDCPSCGARGKLRWSPMKKRGICFAGHCGVKVRGEDEYRALFKGGAKSLPPLYLIRRETLSEAPPPETDADALLSEDPWRWPASRAFLGGDPPKGRGLSRETVEASRMGGDGRHIWVDLDPVCRGYPTYRYRRPADGSGPWMPHRAGVKRQAYVYGLAAWLTRGQPRDLVLFEGVFDVLGTGMLGRALALMGSSLSADLGNYLDKVEGLRVFYWPDPDAAGQVGYKKAARLLGDWDIPCRGVATAGRPELNPKFVGPERARSILAELGWRE